MFWKWGIKMQISVIKPDGENIQKFKDIMQYVYSAYGVQSVEAYIIKEDGELGFLFYGSEMNMYVNNKKSGIEFIAFQLDENGNMIYYGDQEYRIKFDGTGLVAWDAKGNESYLCVSRLLEGLEADFNSYLCYRQYNQDTDTSCELQYAQSLNLDKHDTSIYTREVENIFIDPRWTTKGGCKPGLVTGGKKYFARVDCRGIDIFDGEVDEHSAYLPIRYVGNNGGYYTLGHLSKRYSFDEIKDLLNELGFISYVPERLLEIYKGTDPMLRKLQWIIRDTMEERMKDENEKGIVLQLKLDEDDKN